MIHKKLANGFSDLKESFTVEETEEQKAARLAAENSDENSDEEDEEEKAKENTRVYLEIFIGIIGAALAAYMIYLYLSGTPMKSKFLYMALCVVFCTVMAILFAAFVENDSWAYGLIVTVLMVMVMVLLYLVVDIGPTNETGQRIEGFVYHNTPGYDSTLFDRANGENKISQSEYKTRERAKAAAAV